MLPASAKSLRDISTVLCSPLVSKENETIAIWEFSTLNYLYLQ